MADFTIDDVAENAAKPASAMVSPTSTNASQHSLSSQVDFLKFQADQQATSPANMAKTVRGMFRKIVPPGAY